MSPSLLYGRIEVNYQPFEIIFDSVDKAEFTTTATTTTKTNYVSMW